MQTQPVEVAYIVGKMKGGGVESTALSYLKNIDTKRVHITFIIDNDSTLVPEAEIRGYGGEIDFVPPYQHQIAYQKALKIIFHRRRIDIVHAHINTLSVFPLFAAKQAGIPVRIVHNHATAGKGEWKKNVLKYMLRPFSKVFATDLCACGGYAGNWLFGKHADFTAMPNAIDFETSSFTYNREIRNKKRGEFDLNGCFVVGHVGRFISQKNHIFLLDVFAQIKKTIPKARLLLVGSGELMDPIKEKARSSGLWDSVIFAGQRNDVAELYQAMDILLLPSLYEGKPLVPMEAQMAGLPVVVSDCVTREIVLDPLLVRFASIKDSAEAWADSAEDLYQNAPPRSETKPELNCAADRTNQLPPEKLTDFYVRAIKSSGKTVEEP